MRSYAKCQVLQQLCNSFNLVRRLITDFLANISDDFHLSRINIPISLHYSPIDKFTNLKDFNRLFSELEHTVDFVQTIEQFNHIDFLWGKSAASLQSIIKSETDYFLRLSSVIKA